VAIYTLSLHDALPILGTDDARARVAVNQLIAKDLGKQVSFVNQNAGGRPCPGEQKVRHHPRIVLMPVAAGNVLLPIRPLLRPARSEEHTSELQSPDHL